MTDETRAWVIRSLRWALTAALALLVAALAWAVTLAGGGWHLLWTAALLCVPLPLLSFLTDRRRGRKERREERGEGRSGER
jgi:uncharacterized protein (DUF58 family)